MISRPILWIIRTVGESIAEERRLWKIALEIPYQPREQQVSRTKKEIFRDALYFIQLIVLLSLVMLEILLITQIQPLVIRIMLYSFVGFVGLLFVLGFYILTTQFVAHYQTMSRLKNGEV